MPNVRGERCVRWLSESGERTDLLRASWAGSIQGQKRGVSPESWPGDSWAVASLESGLTSWQSVIGRSLAVVIGQGSASFFFFTES